jgi:hypothetical protein
MKREDLPDETIRKQELSIGKLTENFVIHHISNEYIENRRIVT